MSEVNDMSTNKISNVRHTASITKTKDALKPIEHRNHRPPPKSHQVDTSDYDLIQDVAQEMPRHPQVDMEKVRHYQEMIASGQLKVDLRELAEAIYRKDRG